MPRIFITIFFVAASILLGFFYARPEWRRFRALSQETAELEETSGEFDALIANRNKLLETVNSISKSDLDRLDRILPQGPRTSDFLIALEVLAAENGVSLRRIDLVTPDVEKSEPFGRTLGQPRPSGAAALPGPKEGAEALPFSVQVAGSYGAFKKFLASLEYNVRLIDVEDISFSADKGDNSEFSLKAKTYYQ
jgi:Tfp pilus assembly protein PilO